MDFEQAIINAIALKFFESPASSTDSNGITYYNSAPSTGMIQQLFNFKREDILAAVVEQFDIDDFAKKLANKLKEELLTNSSNYHSGWWGSSEKLKEDIRIATINKLAEQQVDIIKAKFDEEIK